MGRSIYTLLVCAVGIYSSFLTWALVQEPLNTKVWSNSKSRFQAPAIIAITQATVAMLVGIAYITWKNSKYKPMAFILDHKKELALISFTQSASTPLATYSLQYVDYLTYMLAKSCKMMPVLLVHLLLYRTSIPKHMKLVAVLVSIGVAIFTLGGSNKKVHNDKVVDQLSVGGFALLSLSLFLDGITNATQDKMLKANRSKENAVNEKSITGAHLMFALNLFIIIWNIAYLALIDDSQLTNVKSVMTLDPEIFYYLVTYAVCGALGQCFIFYTLEQYGSLILVMITVTRKMTSMMLSILVYGKQVNPVQWLGIFIVFGGITWEAVCKKLKSTSKVGSKID